MELSREKTGFDKKLLLLITILFLIGELLIASTTRVNDGGSSRRVIIQMVAFILGLSLQSLVKYVDYMDFKRHRWIIYGLGIISLLSVYTPLGIIRGGARGWLNLKIIDFQPIEIAKITFIISYADYLDENNGMLNDISQIAKALLMPIPIIILLMLQPDLGGVMVFMCITFGMMFLAGINMKIVTFVIVSGVLLFPLIYTYGLDILMPYQAQRIKDFFSLSGNSLDDHATKSAIAIVSGGFFGKGPFNGDQNRFGFLPVSDSDFIFAVAGEEYGLFGSSILIGLYGLFLSRLVDISRTARDSYGSLIVIGFASLFIYQFIQNVGMAIGLMPITGLTLPFVSYGGSSMLMSMVAIAVVQSVAIRRR